MRVQATREGFYDNVLRPVGEVFDLLNDPDGKMPIRMHPAKPIKDKDGEIIDWEEPVPWLDKDGNAVHGHFAPDGEEVRGRGRFAGERFSSGWMVQVPDDTELGIY